MSKFSWTSLLKRIVGRIDKVKLVRDIFLTILVLTSGFLFQYIGDLNRMSFTDMMEFLSTGTLSAILFIIVFSMPFLLVGLLLIFIRKIDAWEDEKMDDRFNELVDAINTLISEIRQDRNERNKPKQ